MLELAMTSPLVIERAYSENLLSDPKSFAPTHGPMFVVYPTLNYIQLPLKLAIAVIRAMV
jgi:hypothetical protein